MRLGFKNIDFGTGISIFGWISCSKNTKMQKKHFWICFKKILARWSCLYCQHELTPLFPAFLKGRSPYGSRNVGKLLQYHYRTLFFAPEQQHTIYVQSWFPFLQLPHQLVRHEQDAPVRRQPRAGAVALFLLKHLVGSRCPRKENQKMNN